MSAEIIDLKAKLPRYPVPGAREVMIDVINEVLFNPPKDIAEIWADTVLVQLWIRGFKIVPIE